MKLYKEYFFEATPTLKLYTPLEVIYVFKYTQIINFPKVSSSYCVWIVCGSCFIAHTPIATLRF